ncbi:MAG: Hsp33 family molecular chaperone HslO, partial [Pseudomonadota bacterium]
MTTQENLSSNYKFVGDDVVVPFAVEPLDVRGRAIQVGPLLDTILKRHAYPQDVGFLLGELIVLTIILGSSLKFEGNFILQTQSDGPVSLTVVDFSTPGSVRAYARFDEAAIEKAAAQNRASPRELLGEGVMALTIDQGADMQRYQGVVALDGITLEEVAHQYFRQSEQIPTRVRLAVAQIMRAGEGGGPVETSWRAGG